MQDRPWDQEEDDAIMDRPWRLNDELGLARSPVEIEFRRAYLACKALMDRPCVALGIQGRNFYAAVFERRRAY
jgi:hypothetical protein